MAWQFGFASALIIYSLLLVIFLDLLTLPAQWTWSLSFLRIWARMFTAFQMLLTLIAVIAGAAFVYFGASSLQDIQLFVWQVSGIIMLCALPAMLPLIAFCWCVMNLRKYFPRLTEA